MDEHHIFCNGNPASPIEGCHWCDGPKGFWATHPYNKPPMNNELERIEFLEGEIERLHEALHDIEDSACHYANETVESLKSRIDGIFEDAQKALYPSYTREDVIIQPPIGQGSMVELDEESERILRQNLWNLYSCSTCQGDPYLQPCEDCGKE